MAWMSMACCLLFPFSVSGFRFHKKIDPFLNETSHTYSLSFLILLIYTCTYSELRVI